MANAGNKALQAKVRELQCGGNTERELKHLVQDVLNAGGGDKYYELIADRAYLGVSTVRRVANMDKNGEIYNPRADTLERILKAAGCRLTAEYISIKGQYMPKPKVTK